MKHKSQKVNDKRMFLVEYRDLYNNKTTKHMTNVREIRIRPQAPTMSKGYIAELSLMNDVEVFNKDHWCKGKVRSLLNVNKVGVFIHETHEIRQFDVKDVRICYEWVNGSWCPPVTVKVSILIDE